MWVTATLGRVMAVSTATAAFYHDPQAWLPWVVCAAAAVVFVSIIVGAATIASHREAVREDRNAARLENPAEGSDPGSSRTG